MNRFTCFMKKIAKRYRRKVAWVSAWSEDAVEGGRGGGDACGNPVAEGTTPAGAEWAPTTDWETGRLPSEKWLRRMRRSTVEVVAVSEKEHQVEGGVLREPPPPTATVKLHPLSWIPHCGPGRTGRTLAPSWRRRRLLQRPGCSGWPRTSACASRASRGRRRACRRSDSGTRPSQDDRGSSCGASVWSSAQLKKWKGDIVKSSSWGKLSFRSRRGMCKKFNLWLPVHKHSCRARTCMASRPCEISGERSNCYSFWTLSRNIHRCRCAFPPS